MVYHIGMNLSNHPVTVRIARQKGFTLIELLVVIAIIGILSSIVLASLNTARAKGRDARRVSDIKQIQLSLELYYDACGNYPANIYTTSNNVCGSTSSGVGLVQGGYISVVPYDPSAPSPCTADGGSGCYAYTGLCQGGGLCTPTSYHLGAVLEVTNSVLANDSDSCINTTGNAQTGTTCGAGPNVYDAPVSSNSNLGDFSGLDKSANTGTNTLCAAPVGTSYPGTETCFDVTP